MGEEVAAKAFRDDLFYRLGVIPINIPPLKERREDIIPLADFYFESFKSQFLCKAERFSAGALEFLRDYDWPGNVRELKNIIERILVLGGGKVVIEEGDLPEGLRPEGKKGTEKSFKEQVEDFEKGLISEALLKTGYNQAMAARELKTTRRILRYKAEQYGLSDNAKG